MPPSRSPVPAGGAPWRPRHHCLPDSLPTLPLFPRPAAAAAVPFGAAMGGGSALSDAEAATNKAILEYLHRKVGGAASDGQEVVALLWGKRWAEDGVPLGRDCGLPACL